MSENPFFLKSSSNSTMCLKKMKDEKIGLSALARNEMSYPMVKMFWDSAGMEAMRR